MGNMGRKIQQLKAWWLPEINLDITLEHTKFSKIPLENTQTMRVKVSNGISKLWYDEKHIKPALARGLTASFCGRNETVERWQYARLEHLQ